MQLSSTCLRWDCIFYCNICNLQANKYELSCNSSSSILIPITEICIRNFRISHDCIFCEIEKSKIEKQNTAIDFNPFLSTKNITPIHPIKPSSPSIIKIKLAYSPSPKEFPGDLRRPFVIPTPPPPSTFYLPSAFFSFPLSPLEAPSDY